MCYNFNNLQLIIQQNNSLALIKTLIRDNENGSFKRISFRIIPDMLKFN